jgi:hypothetical protein
MLTDEQFSSCIEALSRIGVVERVAGEGAKGERLRLKLETQGVIGRIFGGEMGDPPRGPGLVPWFSCAALKILLDEKGLVVSKEEFTAMAAVIAGFMTEADLERRPRPGDDRPLISQSRAKRIRR